MSTGSIEEFQAARPRLFGIAYRMLGSASDAEDVVQDAWLRWQSTDRDTVREPAAFLAKVVTNLCLNVLDSARVRRESYVGSWLPEPVLTVGDELGPLDSTEQRDTVSLALLTLLEQLTPAERAAYVLREAFGYSHAEIAGILDLSDANARQLFSRAKAKVAGARSGAAPAHPVDPAEWTELVTRFMRAARNGDLAGLERLLAHDVTSWADGGGIINAARNPIRGRDHVARYFAGVFSRFTGGLTASVTEANGEPVIAVFDAEGIRAVWFVELVGDEIAGMSVVVNPEKLRFVRTQLSQIGELPGLSW